MGVGLGMGRLLEEGVKADTRHALALGLIRVRVRVRVRVMVRVRVRVRVSVRVRVRVRVRVGVRVGARPWPAASRGPRRWAPPWRDIGR